MALIPSKFAHPTALSDTETNVFPLSLKNLEKVEPIYTELQGWDQDISGITAWEELPDTAQSYIQFIENYLGVPFKIISTGPKRNETIIR